MDKLDLAIRHMETDLIRGRMGTATREERDEVAQRIRDAGYETRDDGSLSDAQRRSKEYSERVKREHGDQGEPDTRGANPRGVATRERKGEYVSGSETELRDKQSMFDYAATRGMLDNKRLPRDLREGDLATRMAHYNEFFTDQLRSLPIPFSVNGSHEFRTTYGLEEGIATGSAGSGASLVPTILGHDVIDLIRAKTFLFQAGATTVPMPSEFYNLPTWEADVAPAYLSEATATSLDTTPQAGILKFVASNAWVDNTAASLQVVQDAANNGGVAELITNSITEKWARKLESLAVYGDGSAVTNQAPGWLAESIMTQSMGTNGAVPTSYSDVSKAAAQVRAQNVEPTAIISHPSVMAQYAQMVDTLGQPMRKTPDIENLPWFDSGTLNGYSETQGSSEVASGLYVGDFSYVKVGVRLDPPIQIMPLRERYADQLLIAWVSYFRGAFRVARATQTMCKLEGILA